MSEHQKAESEKGNLEMLAQEVAKALTDERTGKRLSLRQAQIKTGVSMNTIDRLLSGIPVQPQPIVKIIEATIPKEKQADAVLLWLRLGGYDEMLTLRDIILEGAERDRAERGEV